MRIHVIGINYWPEKTGIAVFSTGRAEYLASRGHHVTMYTAVPYYPEWRTPSHYRAHPFVTETRENVTIRRCPIYVPSQVTPVRRIAHEASFLVGVFARALLGPRPDLVFVVSPPLGLGAVAAVLGRLWRVPHVFHVEDLQPDAALDLGMVKPGGLARALYALERIAYRRASLVSTLTSAMRNKIVAKGVDARKVVLFSNWASPELFTLNAPAADPELRRELGLLDTCIALHIGNMGVKQGLEVLIEAARRRPDAGVQYVLVGDGVMRGALEARAAGLRNVRILPLLDHERFQRLLATAEICLITQQRSVADIVFPSKVLTLLAAAKPVVASVTAGSEVGRVIADSAAGEVVPPEDPDALAAAVERLQHDEASRARCSTAGREYARRHWERSEALKYLGDQLQTLVERRSSSDGIPARA